MSDQQCARDGNIILYLWMPWSCVMCKCLRQTREQRIALLIRFISGHRHGWKHFPGLQGGRYCAVLPNRGSDRTRGEALHQERHHSEPEGEYTALLHKHKGLTDCIRAAQPWEEKLPVSTVMCLICRQNPSRECTWGCCSCCFASGPSVTTRWVCCCALLRLRTTSSVIITRLCFSQVPLSENLQHPMLYEWVSPIMSVYLRM